MWWTDKVSDGFEYGSRGSAWWGNMVQLSQSCSNTHSQLGFMHYRVFMDSIRHFWWISEFHFPLFLFIFPLNYSLPRLPLLIHVGFPRITRHMFITLLHNPHPPTTSIPALQLNRLLNKAVTPSPCSAHPFSTCQSCSRQAWVIHWAILPLALSWPIYFMQRRSSHYYNQAACFTSCSPEYLILACFETADQPASTCWVKAAHDKHGLLLLFTSFYALSFFFFSIRLVTPRLHLQAWWYDVSENWGGLDATVLISDLPEPSLVVLSHHLLSLASLLNLSGT